MLLAGRSIYSSLKQIQEDYSGGWINHDIDISTVSHFFSLYVDRGKTVRSIDITDFFPFYINNNLGSISILYESDNVDGCWIIEKKKGRPLDSTGYSSKEFHSLIDVEEFLNGL